MSFKLSFLSLLIFDSYGSSRNKKYNTRQQKTKKALDNQIKFFGICLKST